MLFNHCIRGAKRRTHYQKSIHGHTKPSTGGGLVSKAWYQSSLAGTSPHSGYGSSLERYHLQLTSILSAAVIQHAEGSTRYLVPLQDGIVINHPDDLFQEEEVMCSVLDQRTVITFDDSFGRHQPTQTQ